jgi:uncharacterized protein DUF2695
MDETAGQSGAGELRTLPGAHATPLPVECLACYVWRMLDEFGCNATLRWARNWRDARAQRATALERKLARRGGCCDCQLFLNVWTPRLGAGSGGLEGSWQPRSARLSCRGVRRGSAQPCAVWSDPR